MSELLLAYTVGAMVLGMFAQMALNFIQSKINDNLNHRIEKLERTSEANRE